MLCRFDVTVPESVEEELLGLAERLGVQSFSSPCIIDGGVSEESFSFTGETVVSFIFSSVEQDVALIKRELETFLVETGLSAAISSREYADNEDWMQQFKSYFVPIKVGEHIIIRPPWHEPLPEEANATVILIDPGMAFGTGTHETTRLCLELLTHEKFQQGTILDVGAGSGILSFYLLKNHARQVTAIEIDGPAVENLRKNFDLNGQPGSFTVLCADLHAYEPKELFDGLVANITSPVLLDNFQRFFHWLKPGGWAVFSGINSTNAPAIQQALADHGFAKIKKTREGEWFAFRVTKPRS
jgi:ribosomal protein L11 methyltransferase